MFKRILVADDGSEEALYACALACGLAKASGGRVTLARVIDPDSAEAVEVDPAYAREAGAVPKRAPLTSERSPHITTGFGGATYAHGASERFETAVVPSGQVLESMIAETRADLIRRQSGACGQDLCDEPAVLAGDPAEQIIRKAEQDGFDLVVTATHRSRAIARAIAGSVADEVRRECKVPTLMFNPGEGELSSEDATPYEIPRSVLVPVTVDEPTPDEVIMAAEDLARSLKAPVVYVHAVEYTRASRAGLAPPSESWDAKEMERSEKLLNELAEKTRLHGLQADAVLAGGDVERVIETVARNYPDSIIVMHSRDTEGLERWLFGSVADSLGRKSGLPVVDVP